MEIGVVGLLIGEIGSVGFLGLALWLLLTRSAVVAVSCGCCCLLVIFFSLLVILVVVVSCGCWL